MAQKKLKLANLGGLSGTDEGVKVDAAKPNDTKVREVIIHEIPSTHRPGIAPIIRKDFK